MSINPPEYFQMVTPDCSILLQSANVSKKQIENIHAGMQADSVLCVSSILQPIYYGMYRKSFSCDVFCHIRHFLFL